nr:RHS repeat domain-containing protein [Streptomyces actuosus]
MGNVVRASAPGHSPSSEREFEGSLIRRAGRATYEHDTQGRRVRRTVRLLNGQTRTWTYAWTAEDRLSEVVTPDGECWRYTYDPLGRRVSRHRVAVDGSAAVARNSCGTTPASPSRPIRTERPPSGSTRLAHIGL